MELGDDVAVVQLPEDDQGLAAGQFAAFYRGTTCLGSGVILESWDDQGFPVCERALEIAGMEDKSLLGKPVKIYVKPEEEPPTSESETKRPRSSHIIPNAGQRKSALFFMIWVRELQKKWFSIF